MLFSFNNNNNGRVESLRSVQQVENLHLRMSHVDTISKGIVLTCTMRFDGSLNFESFIDRLSDVIPRNPNFIRFRSKYNEKTNSWTPIDGWSARQNSICHNDDASSELALKQAEARSIERVQTMKNGCAWVCHFKYHPVTDETTIRWILSHGLGDGYTIRSVFISLLDDYHSMDTSPPKLRTPFGMSFYRAWNDIRLAKHRKPLKNKPAPPTTMAKSSNHQQVERVHPIEFPALSLQKIKRLAKENKVTMQDLLIHIVAETKKRIGESQDDWILCPFNQRGLQQLDRMDNRSALFPVDIGNGGDLRRIHRSTKMIKGSSLVTHKGYQRVNRFLKKTNGGIPPPPQNRIISLTNMVGVVDDKNHNTVFGHTIRSMRFYAHGPNSFFFISCGSSLYTTFPIEESKRTDRGELVRKTFMQIVEEMNLLSDDAEGSRQRESVAE